MTASDSPPNRLGDSTSPYLRQHAHNPVDWFPWGPEALAKAREEHKPILLSVGYSSCHWCHVMAHESFEDPATAEVLNARYVCIKVDREERPDIDAIYQRVVQLMGEGGGWPLTVFLTPEATPFYGGTYFPPQPRHGRPGFAQLARSLHEAFTERPEQIEQHARQFAEGFAALSSVVDEAAERAAGDPAPWDSVALRVAARRLLRRQDVEWGGFGREPKFPSPTALEVMLRLARDAGSGDATAGEAAAMLSNTLARMYRGGIYDHLRGGFARYSVDRVWLVPHFEKMLYDNAQLLPLYAEAAVLWPEQAHLRRVAAEIVAYLEADMRTPAGTFYAATDADSEGEEGKFFCWTPAQISDVLGDDEEAARFCAIYGVTPEGNFEHDWSILHLPRPLSECAAEHGIAEEDLLAALERSKRALLERRERRVAPHRDDKVITSWVAMLVSGLARAAAAAAVWGDGALAQMCQRLADGAATRLIEAHVVEGRVMRAEFEGTVHTRGVLDDVACLARACLDLHELTLAPAWLGHARTLAAHAVSHHLRPAGDGFFLTADDGEALIDRIESQHDGPIPSGVGVIVEVLARLDAAEEAPEGARQIVHDTLHRFHGAMSEPFGYASLLTAARHADERACHVGLYGPGPDDPWVRRVAAAVLAHRLRSPHAISLSFHVGDRPAATVCRGQVCSLPLSTLDEVTEALR
jgi:uncharacterized protein YyaL (SSP411 family)